MARYRRFEQRRYHRLAPIHSRGHVLKQYAVVYGRQRFGPDAFAGGVALALRALPAAAPSRGRAGAGFLICHQGRTANYVVLCWWDQENELPMRVFVQTGGRWRKARDSESMCVWDLDIIWFERNAWIATALSGRPLQSSLATYLDSHFAPEARQEVR